MLLWQNRFSPVFQFLPSFLGQKAIILIFCANFYISTLALNPNVTLNTNLNSNLTLSSFLNCNEIPRGCAKTEMPLLVLECKEASDTVVI